MGRDRIVGQCSMGSFADIEHLVGNVTSPEDIDTKTLKHSQTLAFTFAIEAFKRNIPWKLLREVVREVLFWGDSDKIHQMEVRFLQDPKKIDKITKFRKLWGGT